MVDKPVPKAFPEHSVRPAEHHPETKAGSVMSIASKNPIAVYQTTTVKQACAVMVDSGIRRVPVVDAGTKKLVGILSARDIVDFFGGGEKYRIVKNEFRGNLFAAVNLPVSKIMNEDVVSVRESETIGKAARIMLEKGVGGCPVVDSNGVVTAVVSERDFIKRLVHDGCGIKVGDIMSRDVITVTPETSLATAARIMISKGVRRLPVVEDGEVVGILRTSGILRFISASEFARFGTTDSDEILEREKVGDALRGYFVAVRPTDDIEEVMEIILARRLGGFAVEDGGKLVGIVTEHDIFRIMYSGEATF